MQIDEPHLHVFAKFLIERPQRFIKEQHIGLDDHRSGKRNPLLLPTAELVWFPPLEPLQLDHCQRAIDSVRKRRTTDLSCAQPERHVLEHIKMREQGVALEDDPDVSRIGWDPAHGATGDDDLALVGVLESSNQSQRRALATAARSQKGEKLSLCAPEGRHSGHRWCCHTVS